MRENGLWTERNAADGQSLRKQPITSPRWKIWFDRITGRWIWYQQNHAKGGSGGGIGVVIRWASQLAQSQPLHYRIWGQCWKGTGFISLNLETRRNSRQCWKSPAQIWYTAGANRQSHPFFQERSQDLCQCKRRLLWTSTSVFDILRHKSTLSTATKTIREESRCY